MKCVYYKKRTRPMQPTLISWKWLPFYLQYFYSIIYSYCSKVFRRYTLDSFYGVKYQIKFLCFILLLQNKALFPHIILLSKSPLAVRTNNATSFYSKMTVINLLGLIGQDRNYFRTDIPTTFTGRENTGLSANSDFPQYHQCWNNAAVLSFIIILTFSLAYKTQRRS